MNSEQTSATIITLPPTARGDTPDVDDATGLGARHCRPKVLFVDDERQVVDGLRRAFLKYPYRIRTATSPELALQMLRDDPCDVIVADEQMPGMRGSELLTIVAHDFPTAGRILLTGHATVEAAARAVNEAGVIRLLLKPCPPENVRAAIETALRTTPFEKRARSSARRVFLVRHLTGTASETGGTKQRAGARRKRSVAVEGSASSGTHSGAAGAPHTRWDTGELMLQAQKVVTLSEPRLYGYELSTRLRSPSGGVHSVGNFIASADHEIPLQGVDRWVVRHVLRTLREHGSVLEQRGITMSLNVAGQSLADPEFTQFFDWELSRSGIGARFLIEIRQPALIKSLQRDDGALRRFFEMDCFKWGCRVCIDGVGGDIGQLASLTSLPVTVAKIDSVYIRDILTNRQSEATVRAVVEWGQRAGIDIAATGVDSSGIAERLRALGVQYGQGTACGAPEPINLILRGLYS